MFKLATLRVPASEAAAIKEMLRLEQAHISERMRGERERWKSVLGGVKLVKGRVSGRIRAGGGDRVGY